MPGLGGKGIMFPPPFEYATVDTFELGLIVAGS